MHKKPTGTKAWAWKTRGIIRPEQFCVSLMTKGNHQVVSLLFLSCVFPETSLCSHPACFKMRAHWVSSTGRVVPLTSSPLPGLVPVTTPSLHWGRADKAFQKICDLRHISMLYSNFHLKKLKYHITGGKSPLYSYMFFLV